MDLNKKETDTSIIDRTGHSSVLREIQTSEAVEEMSYTCTPSAACLPRQRVSVLPCSRPCSGLCLSLKGWRLRPGKMSVELRGPRAGPAAPMNQEIREMIR